MFPIQDKWLLKIPNLEIITFIIDGSDTHKHIKKVDDFVSPNFSSVLFQHNRNSPLNTSRLIVRDAPLCCLRVTKGGTSENGSG